MSLWSKCRPLVEAGVVLILVCTAIFFTERDPSPLNKASVKTFSATDLGKHLLNSAGLSLDGHRSLSFKGFSSFRSQPSTKAHHFTPLALGAVSPLICANYTHANYAGVYGACEYLVPLGQTGCCQSDPVDLPSVDYWCPAAILTKQHHECFRHFQSFWCNAVCNPTLTTNTSCSARFYNLFTLCAPICPYLVQFLPRYVLDSSNTPLGNETVCNYSVIPLPTATPNITQFTSASSGNLITFTNVTVGPTVYFNITVFGPTPGSTVVQVASGGQVYFAFNVPNQYWTYAGNNYSTAFVAGTIDLNALVASRVWNFTVTAVCGNAVGTSTSTPVFVFLNITAPVNKNVSTLNVGGCDGTGSGSGSFNNTGSSAITTISNLKCLCASSCNFVSPVTTVVAITVLQINASVTSYSSNMVVSSALNLGPLATQLILAAAALLTLQCPVAVTSTYSFTGSSSSTVAFSSSSSTFTAPVAFSGPVVTLANTIISISASVLTVNATSTCTVSSSSSINLDSSSSLVASGSTITTTVLTVIGGRITGSGSVKLRQGIARFQSATIQVLVLLSTLIVFTRDTSAQATVTSCGDLMSGGFTFGSTQTQLTVDESCSVPSQTSYSSYISSSLNVIAGSTLQLTNVASTSNPLYIGGSFTLSGVLNVVFASSPGSVLYKTIISYTAGTCSAPSSSLVTYTNAPSGVTNYILTATQSGGVCNIQISALVASTTTYSLTLNQPSTYTSSNFLTTLKSAMPSIDTNLVSVISIVPGSVIVTFNCFAGDSSTATTTCNTIKNTAQNPSSALYSSLGVILFTTTTTTSTSSGSNSTTTTTTASSTFVTFGATTGGQGSGEKKGLLGLIALVAILPIALVAFWIYKVKTRPEVRFEDTGKDFQLPPPEVQPQPNFAAPPYVVNQGFPAYYGAPQAPVQYYATPTPTPTPLQ